MLPRQELITALSDSFDFQKFREMLSEHLSRDLEQIVAPGTPMSKSEIIGLVVADADTKLWALDLIRAARQGNQTSPQLRAFVEHYPEWDPDRQPVPVNPFESVFMRGGRLFLKRDELRRKLREIGTGGNSRVLAIKGERDTGKTYSRDFLNFIRENYGGWAGTRQVVIYIDMDKCPIEPEDLARVIGGWLGLKQDTMPPDKGEQAPRRIPALIEWLGQKMVDTLSTVWWIVLDGFLLQRHSSATHDLIRALIDAVDRDWQQTRLLLLNYEKYLDLDTSAYILMEEIQPLQRTDVEEFFRMVYTKTGKAAGPDIVKQTVDSLFLQIQQQQAKHPEISYFTLLSSGLSQAARKLLQT